MLSNPKDSNDCAPAAEYHYVHCKSKLLYPHNIVHHHPKPRVYNITTGRRCSPRTVVCARASTIKKQCCPRNIEKQISAIQTMPGKHGFQHAGIHVCCINCTVDVPTQKEVKHRKYRWAILHKMQYQSRNEGLSVSFSW